MEINNENIFALIVWGTTGGAKCFFSNNINEKTIKLDKLDVVREHIFADKTNIKFYCIEQSQEYNSFTIYRTIKDNLGRPGYYAISLLFSANKNIPDAFSYIILDTLSDNFFTKFVDKSNGKIDEKINNLNIEIQTEFAPQISNFNSATWQLVDEDIKSKIIRKEKCVIKYKDNTDLDTIFKNYQDDELINYSHVFYLPINETTLSTNLSIKPFPKFEEKYSLEIRIKEKNNTNDRYIKGCNITIEKDAIKIEDSTYVSSGIYLLKGLTLKNEIRIEVDKTDFYNEVISTNGFKTNVKDTSDKKKKYITIELEPKPKLYDLYIEPRDNGTGKLLKEAVYTLWINNEPVKNTTQHHNGSLVIRQANQKDKYLIKIEKTGYEFINITDSQVKTEILNNLDEKEIRVSGYLKEIPAKIDAQNKLTNEFQIGEANKADIKKNGSGNQVNNKEKEKITEANDTRAREHISGDTKNKESEKKKSNKSKIIILASAIGFALIAGIIIFFSWQGQQKKKDIESKLNSDTVAYKNLASNYLNDTSKKTEYTVRKYIDSNNKYKNDIDSLYILLNSNNKPYSYTDSVIKKFYIILRTDSNNFVKGKEKKIEDTSGTDKKENAEKNGPVIPENKKEDKNKETKKVDKKDDKKANTKETHTDNSQKTDSKSDAPKSDENKIDVDNYILFYNVNIDNIDANNGKYNPKSVKKKIDEIDKDLNKKIDDNTKKELKAIKRKLQNMLKEN